MNAIKRVDVTENIPEPAGTKGWGAIVIARWLASQPFTNILLIVFIAGAGWFIRWLVVEGVPAHLQQIQDGYNSVIQTDRQNEKERRDTFSEQLKMIADKFEKDQDRDFQTNQAILEERRREWERRKAEIEAIKSNK